MTDSKAGPRLDRRGFMGASAFGGAALVGGLAAAPVLAQEISATRPAEGAPQVDFPSDPRAFGGSGTNRTEMDLFDCEVEGDWPKDLNGAFYRVGPDPQYPKPEQYKNDIPFDGEGHVSMFRIKDGHVDYKTRYARNARWLAQHNARRSLFGMYRNPSTDHPTVDGYNRGTANTQLFVHHGKLLAFKEDSPPVAMDPLTLETTDPEYTYGGRMMGKTHTAHPKIDPKTGGLIAFGYEATGFLSKDIEVFETDAAGNITWQVMVEAPYAGMMHDFCATEDYIVLYLTNLAADAEQIAAGGVHFRYDSTLPCYLGVMRRGGDGSDLKWLTGPNLFCTHVMAGWNEGTKITVDMDGGEGNQFPFFPSKHEPWDPVKGTGYIRRFTVDMGQRNVSTYQAETIYPHLTGMLARQDDRFHTLKYRWGFLNTMGAQDGWAVIDHATGNTRVATVPGFGLSELCFVPRTPTAAEGDGYLIGIGNSQAENGRSDLILFDIADILASDNAAPRARVKLPFRAVGQVHGFWADASAIGAA
ncbi:carotenoid oxygenase family protein [Alteraurantiacibacter buctensis]|uniref:Dioxygenase n=1 Tax=Alteraurantiacibacter buctensis TaxID=1503981 RepID=A0A844YUP5_9SPHN|nr:carotenoid oxygenase family protein [Alteraurantiacibacter buctensis]MXO70224.1 lignostilbene alpha-beta-dioxygenase [Alteraurantiacibacter buctensis]